MPSAAPPSREFRRFHSGAAETPRAQEKESLYIDYYVIAFLSAVRPSPTIFEPIIEDFARTTVLKINIIVVTVVLTYLQV